MPSPESADSPAILEENVERMNGMVKGLVRRSGTAARPLSAGSWGRNSHRRLGCCKRPRLGDCGVGVQCPPRSAGPLICLAARACGTFWHDTNVGIRGGGGVLICRLSS